MDLLVVMVQHPIGAIGFSDASNFVATTVLRNKAFQTIVVLDELLTFPEPLAPHYSSAIRASLTRFFPVSCII